MSRRTPSAFILDVLPAILLRGNWLDPARMRGGGLSTGTGGNMAIHAVNEKDAAMAKSNHGVTKWLHVSKGKSAPEMMIRHWGPETNIPIHSHSYNEMFYVLEGEVEIGDMTYTAGACIFIEKDTPYGPTRAPKGVKVLRYAEARSK